MRLLLIIFGVFVQCTGFPMCTDGQTPLMEANDAFTCDRRCPVGFSCEFQDADFTMTKAICCPNITALQQIYGDEEHSEPIWELSEASAGLDKSLATPTTDHPSTIKGSTPRQEPSSPSASPDPSFEVAADMAATVPLDSPIKTQTTESYEEMRNIEEIGESLILLEPIQDNSSLSTTPVGIEPEGSGDTLNERSSSVIQKKSCSRQLFSITCHKGTIKTQATIRWYFNTEVATCEYYPFGYCPGDKIVESATLRTKAECQEKCAGLAKISVKPEAFFDDISAEAEFSQEKTTSRSPAVTLPEEELQRVTFPTITQLEETSSEKNQIDSAVDSIDPVLVIKVITATEINKNQITAQPESTLDSSTIGIDDQLSEKERENANQSSRSDLQPEKNTTSGKQGQTPFISTLEKIRSGADSNNLKSEESLMETEKMVEQTDLTKGLDKTTAEEEFINIKQKLIGEESSEGVSTKLQSTEKNNGVACDATSYRYSCQNGHPSQFVYRWQMKNGVCQSFAYGYCYGEYNDPHPRTQDECLLHCRVETRRILSL